MASSPRPSPLGMIVVSILLVTSLVAFRVWLEPRFFYWDDGQHTFAPVFYSIGEALRAGQFPTVTPLLWQGGFLAGEGLYQVFNPVSLAIFLLLPSIESIPLGMTLHAGVWLLIGALGIHVLASRVGSTPQWAVLAGFAYATSPFLLYWLSANWINGAIAYGALPWALVFLSRPPARIASLLALTFATYLVAVSGWIHAMIALSIFGVSRLLLPDRRLALSHRVQIGFALAAGVLLASPQLTATLAAVEGSMRPSNVSNLGRGVADLQGLVTLFWPAYVAPPRWFGSNQWSPPLYYAAWFILPAFLVLVGRWRSFFREHAWLIWSGAILLLASLGPEQFGTTRWPIRFLPAIWAVMIVLAVVALSTCRPQHPRRALVHAGAALLLAGILTWQQNPGGVLVLVVLAAIIWAMSSAVLLQTGFELPRMRFAAILGGTGVLVVWMAAEYPVNSAFNEYFGPERRSEIQTVGVAFPGSVVQIYSRSIELNRPSPNTDLDTQPGRRWAGTRFSREETSSVPTGNMALWRRERQVNGYTPVEMVGLKTLTCGESIFGWTCDGPGPVLLSRERLTGRTFADLMRVEAFVVSSRMPESLRFLAALPEWKSDSPSKYATIFRRTTGPVTLPGTLSNVPAGASVDAVLVSEVAREQVIVQRSAGFAGGVLAFARPYYPGYQAAIDGRPAAVQRLGGAIVAVAVPAGEGPVRIEIRHELPMPLLWRACVLLGILCLLAGAWLSVRPLAAPRAA